MQAHSIISGDLRYDEEDKMIIVVVVLIKNLVFVMVTIRDRSQMMSALWGRR